jgi:hypothetical protein
MQAAELLWLVVVVGGPCVTIGKRAWNSRARSRYARMLTAAAKKLDDDGIPYVAESECLRARVGMFEVELAIVGGNPRYAFRVQPISLGATSTFSLRRGFPFRTVDPYTPLGAVGSDRHTVAYLMRDPHFVAALESLVCAATVLRLDVTEERLLEVITEPTQEGPALMLQELWLVAKVASELERLCKGTLPRDEDAEAPNLRESQGPASGLPLAIPR